ncbi:hypothetical protein GUJ93_ZPchr0034g18735 [Zizania palustris]|uniref:Reticulon domain-containing protein n=1 Tax=Zizania palustris TaxID=103762 RepID=A0A8J5QRV0_ZIZPA|nr:hypothetical protein GUJ93_ZPchr0034g18735 [Zizania palustris]
MANSIVASLANTIGAAESVLRVAATGHDKKLLFKVVCTLYFLAALGRVVSGAAVAYAVLCVFCLYMIQHDPICASNMNFSFVCVYVDQQITCVYHAVAGNFLYFIQDADVDRMVWP